MEINILMGLVGATIVALVILSSAVRYSLKSLQEFKQNLTEVLWFEYDPHSFCVTKHRSKTLDNLRDQIEDLNCDLNKLKEIGNTLEERDLLANLEDIASSNLNCWIRKYSVTYTDTVIEEFIESLRGMTTSGYRTVPKEFHETLYELVDYNTSEVLLQETDLNTLQNKMNVLIEAKGE